MAYASWSVVAGEQPSAAKWNILGTNDASFNNGTGLPTANSSVTTVVTSQTTASTSYTDLSTVGPTVTVTVGSSGKVLVTMNCELFTSGVNNAYASILISGATTQAATDDQAIQNGTGADCAGGQSFLLSGLSTGSTTFKMQYRVSAGTGTFARRRVSVLVL